QNIPCHAILSSDDMRERLTGDMSNQRFNKQVFDTLRSMLEIRLNAGCMYTIIDATNLKWKDSYGFIEIAQKAGAKGSVVNFTPPSLEELVERVENRYSTGGLLVPKDVLERQIETYNNCTAHYLEMCEKSGIEVTHYD